MTDPLGLINSGARAGAAPGIRPVAGAGAGGAASRAAGQTSFKDVLMKNIEQVNVLQQDAEKAIEDLNTGRRDDVANVLLAKEKADAAFRMLQQVRNKLVEAYDEVKQMRV